MAVRLIEPHGGTLVDLLATPERAAELRERSRDLPSWTLTERQLCDFELLANGGFSPLRGFMTADEVASVASSMRLPDGTLWPIPITLDVPEDVAVAAEAAGELALRDPEGVLLGVLHVTETWAPDRFEQAAAVFGSTDVAHPGVHQLVKNSHAWCVGGPVEAVQLPLHYDFTTLRLTPAQTRAGFDERGWDRVVAFQTRNPMHRAHVELTHRAAAEADAHLLVHPVVGATKPGDVDHFTRVRVYRSIMAHYPNGGALLSLLPLAMRMAGPREAVWHAIIRRNHGATHLIVGRDHAGPGADASGTPFYGPYDAQDLLREHEDELGVEMVPFKQLVYVASRTRYEPVDEVAPDEPTLSISGTELRRRLATGEELPDWFTYPDVESELRASYPARRDRGLALLLTGLSGAGKSTIANVLAVKLQERGGRRVTLLDGDLVRQHLSSELGFSPEHRDLNIRRIGYVASEIAASGGLAICAPIAPYDASRRWVRTTVEATGAGFVLVHVATPLEVAEARDRKGLYAKARAGLIEAFTGISDPYEPPEDADVVIDTTDISPDEAADLVLQHLVDEGYLDAAD